MAKASALSKNQTIYFGYDALQAQQLKDNAGGAVNMTELTALSGLNLGGTNQPVNAGATLTLTQAANGGNVVFLNHSGGSVVTLPAASGSGVQFTFVVTDVTTGHEVETASASDVFQGQILGEASGTVTAWPSVPATTNIAIKLNGTTSGGAAIGDSFTVTDVATNTWQVSGNITQSGSAVTPFSTSV